MMVSGNNYRLHVKCKDIFRDNHGWTCAFVCYTVDKVWSKCLNWRKYTFLCLFTINDNNLFLVLKLVAFLLLQPSFFFEFLLLHTSLPSLDTTTLTFPLYTVLCCPPMPPRRESLGSVKTRLAREQKIRTDRRVGELLHPRERTSDIEVFDDSEEDDRIASRRARGLGVQRQFPYFSSFCGVFLVFALLWFLL